MRDLSYAIETLTIEKHEYEERISQLSCNSIRYKRFEKKVEQLKHAIEILQQHNSK
ncbi:MULTISPECIES: hypothetical protein [Bacillus]|uniref:hypothetical protein n=1 Tax=Bacillus TaxID=1386 RepID=UPI0012B688F7|nr:MULTISPECIES: hypothetical protein [Bacillus]